jgi:beta-lactamase regulating signal transducer with metallopeptidase domain
MSTVLGTLASPAAAAAKLLPILADAALKGVVVFGIAAIAVALCRRKSSATRHAIWAGAVVAQLTLPVLSALLPAWRVPIVDRLQRRFLSPDFALVSAPVGDVIVTTNGAGFNGVSVVAPAGAYGGADVAPLVVMPSRHRHGHSMTIVSEGGRRFILAPAVAPGSRLDVAPAIAPVFGVSRVFRHRSVSWWLRFAAVTWLVGAILIFARFLAGTLAVSRLARRSERVEDGRWLSLAQRVSNRLGVARPMTLLRSGRFGIPVTWGVVYPVVLLPEDADDWTDERRRYVLVHEMAHVKRVDAFTQLLAQLAIAAFWFDPLVWVAAHRMRVEREHACDDYVLREGTPASTYAADLLAMVRSLGSRGRAAQPAFAALAMARPAELEGRVQAILDPKQERGALQRAPALALALCSLALLVPLAAFRPFGARSRDSFSGSRTSIAPAAVALEAPPTPAVPEIPEIAPAMAANLQARLSRAFAAVAATRAAREATAALASTINANVSAAVATTASAASVATTSTSSWASENASCSSISLRRTGTSTSVHSNEDDDNRSYQYISSSAGRCLQLALWGHVEFTPDERDVSSLSRDGRLYIRERREDADRELDVTADGDQNPRYAYRVNGDPAGFDDDARQWLGELLPEILRESGLNAPARVARLRRDGGVEAVLADIARTQSTSARRAEYEALLRSGQLSDDDVQLVMRQAGDDLSSSDSELRAVLAQMGHTMHSSEPMAHAFAKAVEHISSDDEKRSLLEEYAATGNRDMLLVTMREAESIGSDDEKSSLLRSTVARYLNCDDEELHNVYFKTLRSIGSDEEKRGALMAALPYAKQRGVLMAVLDAAKDIGSDSEKAELLIEIAKQGLAATGPAHDAFLRVTKSISSDSEYRRVVEVAFAR